MIKKYRPRKKKNEVLMLFFDFYILNEIWFKTIGMTEYNYQLNKILPYNKERIIDCTFKNILNELKNRIILALDKSVRGEIGHMRVHGPWVSCNPKNKKHFVWYRKNKYYYKLYGYYAPLWSLEAIQESFNRKGWTKWYGGKKWALATQYLIDLKNSKDIKNDIYIIDRIFDLQHNTGFILNKTEFKCLSKYNKIINKRIFPLNLRFNSTIEEMVKYGSDKVYKIFMANKNYL